MVHFVAPDFNPVAMNENENPSAECAKQGISHVSDGMEK
jgi:hypothetical protein